MMNLSVAFVVEPDQQAIAPNPTPKFPQVLLKIKISVLCV